MSETESEKHYWSEVHNIVSWMEPCNEGYHEWAEHVNALIFRVACEIADTAPRECNAEDLCAAVTYLKKAQAACCEACEDIEDE